MKTTVSIFNDFFDLAFDEVLQELAGTPLYPQTYPPLDVYLNKDTKDCVMQFAVAGIPKDKIKISIDGDYVILDIEQVNRDKEGFERIQKGLKTGRVYRKFMVPAGRYDMSGITSKLEDGLLTISIPAKEDQRKRSVEIN